MLLIATVEVDSNRVHFYPDTPGWDVEPSRPNQQQIANALKWLINELKSVTSAENLSRAKLMDILSNFQKRNKEYFENYHIFNPLVNPWR